MKMERNCLVAYALLNGVQYGSEMYIRNVVVQKFALTAAETANVGKLSGCVSIRS